LAEVVVLSAVAHAFRRGRRARVVALLPAEKDVFELVHPRVGEQQRRVVMRHERRARDNPVGVALEVLQERAANLVGSHWGFDQYSTTTPRARRRSSIATWPGSKPCAIRYRFMRRTAAGSSSVRPRSSRRSSACSSSIVSSTSSNTSSTAERAVSEAMPSASI